MQLARILEQNGLDCRAEFIALLNRRGADYAAFEFPEGTATHPVLRYAAQQFREAMAGEDQPWVMDQVMEIELPGLLALLRKTISGLIRPATASPR